MTGAKRKFGVKHGVALVVATGLAVGLTLVYLIGSGIADRWARRTVIEQLEKTTGARVELGNFHFSWRLMSAQFDGLTLYGREPAGTPPLFRQTFQVPKFRRCPRASPPSKLYSI
jgi:hypothetical protein